MVLKLPWSVVVPVKNQSSCLPVQVLLSEIWNINMSYHVVSNLLNKLGKRDKMRGLPSILSLFRNKFNKFNNTGARMLDSIYHMLLKNLRNCSFGVKTLRVSLILGNIKMGVIAFPVNL